MDLYLAGADGSNPQVILAEIRLAEMLKWSPIGTQVAFRGQYKGVQGIWILNTTTKERKRVWKELDSYDWSPDGTRMVIMEHRLVNNKTQEIPIIIDVSKTK